MSFLICVTCGTQFARSPDPPAGCPVCEDERQYVGWQGQEWTTLEALAADHRNRIEDEAAGLTGIGPEPAFAIGQRALLVRTESGNVLWDCVPLIDARTVERVERAGGIRAIAISHPHFYASMVEWSRAFGGVPVHLHAADREWVMRPDPAVVHWDGDRLDLGGGVSLVRLGGHFPGGTVLHWTGGADGRGALLSGDILQVTQDRRHVSFMYSYPNYIPLGGEEVRRIAAAVDALDFDDVYGAWWRRNVIGGAKEAVRRSAARYLARVLPADGDA